MSKITFNRVVSNFGFKAAFNNLLERIEQEFQDKVLYRNNPSGEPNTMFNDLDMGGKDVLNIRNINATGLVVDGKNVYQVLNDALDAPAASVAAKDAAEAARLNAEAAAAALPTAMSFAGTDTTLLGNVIVGTSPKTGYRNITVQNTQESTGAGSSFNLSANASSLTLAISSSVDGNYATITNNNGPVIVGTGSANPVALTVNSVPRLLVDSTGDCGVVSPTNKLGYVGGAGGSVIQSTSKITNVTLNKPCGQITLNSASLGANTVAVFGLMNSTLKATDVLNITQQSPGIANYNIWVYYQGDGAAYIAVKNITGIALAEEIVLNFAVLKGVVA